MNHKALFLLLLVLVAGLVLVEAIQARPAAPSSFLGPEYNLCCNDEYTQRYPDAVYNRLRHEYMVVYEDFYSPRLVAGARLGLDGFAFNHFAISGISAPDSSYPAVAFNRTDDEYLVVWQQYNGNQNKWEIYGRIIPGDGLDFTITPFLIAQWSSMSLKYPEVAWNSFRNEYMVVWQTENSTSGQLLGIGRRRLNASGGFLSNADYITQANFPGNPDIAYNPATDQYMVVWAQVGTYAVDIYGGRLSREGALQGSVFPIGEAANEQQFPAIATNEQNRFLVVWQDDRLVAGDKDIYAQFLDGSGNLVSGNFWLAISTADETHPAVAANGSAREYLVVYQQTTAQGERIWADLIDESGSFVDYLEIAPGGLGDNLYPAVATHLAGYFVAYD